MRYYLASLEFGKDHAITATYRVLNFMFPHGTQQQEELAELIPRIPMTLELMSPPSSTQEAAGGWGGFHGEGC